MVLTPPGTATSTCTIDFAFDVLKVPTMPAQPSPPNTVTTAQIGFVTGTAAVDHVTGPRASTRTNPAGLTARVVEVPVLLANGLTNSEIAGQLVLFWRTVDHHVSAVLTKLAVTNRRQVAVAAAHRGIDLRSRVVPCR